MSSEVYDVSAYIQLAEDISNVNDTVSNLEDTDIQLAEDISNVNVDCECEREENGDIVVKFTSQVRLGRE